MPRLPKWIGDTMEAALSSWIHPVEVIETEFLAGLLKRIRFASPRLKKVKWIPGQEVEFRVDDQNFRHYTPSLWNASEGYTDILFYLHGQGPGSHWAEKLASGDQVKLMGPGGKFVLDNSYQQYIFLGDETTIGLFYAMQKAVSPGAFVAGVIECESSAMEWPGKAGLNLFACKRIPEFRGHALLQWMNSHIVWAENSIFYLCGHAGTIQLLKRELLSKGVPVSQIRTKPYWATGKKGL